MSGTALEPFFIFSARYSLARMVRAIIVRVGFCDPPETNAPPSITKRFFTSWLWLKPFSTDFR